MYMDSLEKFTCAMKLTESKKVHVEKAMLSLLVEWKNLEQHLDYSSQQLLQECFTDIQLREDRLNKVQQSVTSSNQVMNEIRNSLESGMEEVERKEKEFGVIYEERSKELGLEEERIDEKRRLIEGVFEKFSLEKSEFERFRVLVDERFEELKLKEKSMEIRENKLEVVRKNLIEKEKVLELREKDLLSIRNLNEKKSKEVESREASFVSKEKEVDMVKQICTEFNLQKEKLDLEKKAVDERATKLETKEKYFKEWVETIDLREKEIELKNVERCRELEIREKNLEDQLKEFELKEKHIKEWVETIDLKEKEIDLKNVSSEERCSLQIREKTLDDQLSEFELKEKHFKELVKTIDLKKKEVDSGRILNEERCKKLDSMEKNLHDLMIKFELEEKQFRDLGKSFEEKEKEVNSIRISCEERCRKFELEKKNEFELKEKHFKELVKTIDLKEKEIDSVWILNEERCKKLDSMEKNLQELLIGLKLKEQHEIQVKSIEAKDNEVDSIRISCEERCRKFELEKKKLEDQMKESIVNKKQFSNVDHSIVKPEPCSVDGSYADIRFSITMGGKNLLSYLINHKRDLDSMADEVFRALRMSMDPGKLVLDAMQDFYLKKEDTEFEEDVVCKSSILLLEQLRRISPQIQSRLKKAATELAREWKNKMKSSGEVIVFLQLLASYGLGSAFEPEEFSSLFEGIGQQIQISELCQLLGYTDKISDLIQVMLKEKQHAKAVRYACVFGLRDKFQPASLLKDLVKNAEEASKTLLENKNCAVDQKEEAIDSIVASLREAVLCIFHYKVESEYCPAHIGRFIEQLIQQKKDEKVRLSASNNDAANPAAKKNCKSAKVVPDPTEGRITGRKTNSLILDSRNALAIVLSAMDGISLQLFLNENSEDHELLGNDILNALKLSREPARLVLDAIQGFQPPHLEMGDKHYESPVIMRSCILLLEQLMKRSPKIKPQVKEEAMKLAFDWKAKMRTPFQILGFLQLITTYGLNSSFEVSELERHFVSVSHVKHAPELCRVFRFSDKRPDQTLTSSICHLHQKKSCGIEMNEKAIDKASFIHSANLAKLVLDAIRKCYYSNLKGERSVNFNVLRCFIILVEKLLTMSPRIQPCVKEEAAKFAVDWKAQLVNTSSKKSAEVFWLFHLLAVYKVASSVDPNELFGLLDSIYIRRGVPNLVRLLGLAHKIPDFIKSLIQKGDRLQAVRYIYEFELVGKFPPVRILKDHLSSKKVTETSHVPKSYAISQELAALRGVVQRIKYHQLEVEYPPENLLAQIQQLEEEQAKEGTQRSESYKKYVNKRRAAVPDPGPEAQTRKKFKKKRRTAGPGPGPEAQTQWHIRKHPRIEPPVGTSSNVPSPSLHSMTNFVGCEGAYMQQSVPEAQTQWHMRKHPQIQPPVGTYSMTNFLQLPLVFNPQNSLYG